jgi:Excreted virulence factor EspC, type VII ESX diderm
MADGFEVDVATLRALAGELTSIGDKVGTAQQGLNGLGDDQTGDGDLTGAVHHFKDKWEYSLKKIRETAEKTAEKVTSASDGYEQVDGAVADAAAGRS